MKTPTGEQLNQTICRWLGWTFHDIKQAPMGGDVYEQFWLAPGIDIQTLNADDIAWGGEKAGRIWLPDHINGIEALGHLHEAEKRLTELQWREWEHVAARMSRFSRGSLPLTIWIARMDARQRATALCRVIAPEIFN